MTTTAEQTVQPAVTTPLPIRAWLWIPRGTWIPSDALCNLPFGILGILRRLEADQRTPSDCARVATTHYWGLPLPWSAVQPGDLTTPWPDSGLPCAEVLVASTRPLSQWNRLGVAPQDDQTADSKIAIHYCPGREPTQWVRRTFEIAWPADNGPLWLNRDNLLDCLVRRCPNTEFEVRDVTGDGVAGTEPARDCARKLLQDAQDPEEFKRRLKQACQLQPATWPTMHG